MTKVLKKPYQRWLRRLWGAMVVLIVAGCGAPGLSKRSTPTHVAQPIPPGTLRWALDGVEDLTSLDPARPVNMVSTTVIGLIFNGLVRLDEHLEVRPELAERWEVGNNGLWYRFYLRPGAAFADGTPVTAEDFVFSINRALAPETASYGAAFQLGKIVGAEDVAAGRAATAQGVRAIDSHTLEIVLEEPEAHFLSQLAASHTFAVPQALVSQPGWEERAYGAGPYRVAAWEHGVALELEPNPLYWRGQPGFAHITMPFFVSSDAAVEAFLAGEVDIVGGPQSPLPAQRVAALATQPDFRTSAALVTRYIGFNQLLPPFEQLAARRALALATDRQALVERVLASNATPASRILPPGMLGTELPIKPLAYDPASAKAELAAAGLTPEALSPISLAYAEEGDNGAVAAELARQWGEALDVEVSITGYGLEEFSRLLDTTYSTPSAGLQIYLSVWGADYPDPHTFISQQLRTGSPNNNGHFSHEEFDDLVGAADVLGKPDELDQRLQLYNYAEQLAIDHVGWLPLYHPTFSALVRADLLGFEITPLGLVVPDWTRAGRR